MNRATLLEQEMTLISELDHIRDTRKHPESLLSGIVQVICQQFRAELCLLYLLNQENSSLELKISLEHTRHWQKFGLEIPEARILDTMHTKQPKLLHPQDLFPTECLPEIPPEMRLGVLPIFMDEEPLGALLLARAEWPRDADTDDARIPDQN